VLHYVRTRTIFSPFSRNEVLITKKILFTQHNM